MESSWPLTTAGLKAAAGATIAWAVSSECRQSPAEVVTAPANSEHSEQGAPPKESSKCVAPGTSSWGEADVADAFSCLRLPNPQPDLTFDVDGSCALIVVDVQTCWYTNSPMLREAFPQLPERMAALLRIARRRGVPVIHIRASYEESPHVQTMRRLNPGLNQVAITPEPEAWACELPGEPVVFKSTFDGFFRTELEEKLRELGVTRVLVSGLVTSACVLNTAFGAFHRGFDVVLVEDCCADRSVARHEATLAMYSDYCFRIVRTVDLDLFSSSPTASPRPSREGREALGLRGAPADSFKLTFGDGQQVSPSTTLVDLHGLDISSSSEPVDLGDNPFVLRGL